MYVVQPVIANQAADELLGNFDPVSFTSAWNFVMQVGTQQKTPGT